MRLADLVADDKILRRFIARLTRPCQLRSPVGTTPRAATNEMPDMNEGYGQLFTLGHSHHIWHAKPGVLLVPSLPSHRKSLLSARPWRRTRSDDGRA